VNMTQSVDLQVQYESAELLTVLAQDCPATLPMIISSLLPLIKNPVIALDDPVQSTNKGGGAVGTPDRKGGEEEVQESATAKGGAKKNTATRGADDSGLRDTHSVSDLCAAAHSWQASSARALEAILHTDEAPRILTEEFGIYALLGALLNMYNVDVRDVALDALRFLAVSHENIGSMTVGQVSSAAIYAVLGDQWQVLKTLDTTVGLVIEDADARKELILRNSGWQTESTLSMAARKKLVENMNTCKRAVHRGGESASAASSNSQSGMGPGKQRSKLIKKIKKKKTQKKVDPETCDGADDGDYRPLMERLIRSSLPELMDRDFGGPARAAIQTRKKAKDRRSGFLTRRA
jgi:hypothetical protein